MAKAIKVGGHNWKFLGHVLHFSEGFLLPLPYAYFLIDFKGISSTILAKVEASAPIPPTVAMLLKVDKVFNSLFIWVFLASIHQKVKSKTTAVYFECYVTKVPYIPTPYILRSSFHKNSAH